ncbi:MAG: hypothetical protein JWR16_2255 [Nevskia sp.]|nr:hypothetical protein [Nevskia sp.]
MRRIQSALLAALVFGASAVCAQPASPVIIKQNSARGTDSNINIQSTGGSACTAPTIGNCGACSVACPTGQAAMCKPGLAVNQVPGASCVTPPECKCQ